MPLLVFENFAEIKIAGQKLLQVCRTECNLNLSNTFGLRHVRTDGHDETDAWFLFLKNWSVTCACNKTNLMYYLSSVYSVTTPLHVSGLLVALHQKVTVYICDNLYAWYVLVDCRQVRWQSNKTYYTYQFSRIIIVTSWWWATSKPETCRGVVTE
jgi:hypothetical protein